MTLTDVECEAWRAAEGHLHDVDPRISAVIRRVSALDYAPMAGGSHFDTLVRSIVFQQLSGRVAETIYRRVTALFGDRPPSPSDLAASDVPILKSAGLSTRKAEYLICLGAHAASPESRIESLHAMEDDEVIAELTQIRGIGRWTAHMFLIFRLGRPDVLPELDLGIRRAIQKEYELEDLPANEDVIRIGEPWRPHRTVACLYLWRSLDMRTPGGAENG